MAHDPLSILNASPAPSTPQKPHLSSFYYGFVAIAAMVVILMAYNFLVVGCCWQSRSGRFERPPRREASHGPDTSIQMLVPVSKYRKKETEMQASNDECSVCLSVFTDGEDIRQLPECKHSFHADCIDMWLYSHSNCPLCRAHVAGEHRRRRVSEAAAAVAADSQQGLPDASSMA